MTPQQPLPRSAPETQGIPASAVLDFVDAAERGRLGLHSLMLVRHGQVVAEGWWDPYAAEAPHLLFSLSKSFTSTAAGLAIEEGLLSPDDPVLSFFPEDAPPEVGPNLAALRVRHLLSMATGHAADTSGRMREAADGRWARAFLSLPIEHAPGTHFVYNNGATYMVSAIVQAVTGQTVLDYLGPRLFGPLGITGATWKSSPQGVTVGWSDLSIRTEDIARFGQLYLQKGMWHGERLLSEAWVSEATTAQVSNGTDPESDWAQGYGYQFWRCRHGAYRADGAFGQFCVVLPEQDAVVAMTAGSADLGGVLNLVWEHLLPAMRPAPLPEDAAADDRLTRRLASLSLPAPAGEPCSPTAARVSGKTFAFSPGDAGNEQGIEAVTWDFTENGSVLTVHGKQGRHRIEGGAGEWRHGETLFGGEAARPVAARGAWVSDDTYVLTACFTGTPFTVTVTAQFSPGQLRLDVSQNVSFGAKERPPLTGRLL